MHLPRNITEENLPTIKTVQNEMYNLLNCTGANDLMGVMLLNWELVVDCKVVLSIYNVDYTKWPYILFIKPNLHSIFLQACSNTECPVWLAFILYLIYWQMVTKLQRLRHETMKTQLLFVRHHLFPK